MALFITSANRIKTFGLLILFMSLRMFEIFPLLVVATVVSSNSSSITVACSQNDRSKAWIRSDMLIG